MNAAKSLITASVLMALGLSTGAVAAPQKDEDSAYQWGRWAVLTPAAGGTETFVNVAMPGALNNARPGDADEFTPDVEKVDPDPGPTPPDIDGFCQAGAQCGYATYQKQPDNNNVQTSAVPEGFDLSEQDPNGPVLARIDITSTPVESEVGTDTDLQPAIAGAGSGPQVAQFSVGDTGNPDFPDIQSLPMSNGGSGNDFSGSDRTGDVTILPDGTFVETTTFTDSSLTEGDAYGGVDTGIWAQDETNAVLTVPGQGGSPTIQIDFLGSNGHFVYGTTATIAQMQAFVQGNVQAVYQGQVLNYKSPVTLNFDFGKNTFQGDFGSNSQFQGFTINGDVQGVNFAGKDGAKAVTGSFFNAGSNASGAVNNGAQLGVFSADHTGSP